MIKKTTDPIQNAYKNIDSLIHSHRQSQIIFSAFDLGVLEILAKRKKLKIAEITDHLKLSKKGLKRLLTALAARGIVESKNGTYLMNR